MRSENMKATFEWLKANGFMCERCSARAARVREIDEESHKHAWGSDEHRALFDESLALQNPHAFDTPSLPECDETKATRGGL